MGVCRWLSSLMTIIMKTLLVKVTRYKERNNAKSKSCSSPKLEKARRTKPLWKVALVCSILECYVKLQILDVLLPMIVLREVPRRMSMGKD